MPYAGDLGRGFPKAQALSSHRLSGGTGSCSHSVRVDLEPGAGNRSASETIMRRHQAYEAIIRNMLPDMMNEDEGEYDT